MARELSIPIVFDRGVNSTDETTLLEPGFASVLENWEPLSGGGLRPRASWRQGGETSAPTTRTGRGIYTGFYVAGARKILVGNKDGSNHELWVADTGDPTTVASWAQVGSDRAISAGYRYLPFAFAAGNSVVLYSNPGLPNARPRYWDGTTDSQVATDDTAGRCLAYHLSRFWTGGTDAAPTYLRWSEVADQTSWNVTENFLPVGQADGEPIEEIVAWDRGMLIGKQHSLWWLSGVTSDTFQVHPIHGSIGCYPGRSMAITPRGIVIIGTDGYLYLWDGSNVEPVNVRHRFPAFAASTYVSLQVVGDRVYANYPGDETLVWDWRRDVLWNETHASPTTEGPQDLGVLDQYLLKTAAAGATSGPMDYRSEVGPLATSGARNAQPDQSMGTAYSAVSAPLFLKDVFGPVTLRSLYLRYRQFTAGVGVPLTITAHADGDSSAVTTGNQAAAGVYRTRKEFGLTGDQIWFAFDSDPSSSEDETYAIEKAVAIVQVSDGRQ